MKKNYYLNLNTGNNPNGNNEVHHSGCVLFNSILNKKYLGEFNNGVDAVNYAKMLGYSKADGCRLCSPEAHHA